jgi:hypothetical protein
MILIGCVCLLLLVLTTFIHYEVLRMLSMGLPLLRMPTRAKLIVVIIATFLAHAAEIFLYAIAFYLLVENLHAGTIGTTVPATFTLYVYFSAETYTSLGYGDVTPNGVLRLLAGMEALNGLLLIGWSASYIYLSMERFWGDEGKRGRDDGAPGAIDRK